MVFHALNRGVGRMKIFSSDRDYQAFEETVEETLRLYPMRILAYCLMPSHWHFVLWPENDGDLSAFLQRLTNTHVQRWQRAKRKVGYGHLYQGRFKSFPVEADDHFYTVVRYVERNALRANLVERAEDWRWGSLWRRVHNVSSPLLSPWPLPEPRNWVESSIGRKPKRKWRRSVVASSAAARMAMTTGRNVPRKHWDWNPRSDHGVALGSDQRDRLTAHRQLAAILLFYAPDPFKSFKSLFHRLDRDPGLVIEVLLFLPCRVVQHDPRVAAVDALQQFVLSSSRPGRWLGRPV